MKTFLLALALCWPVTAFAQPANTVVSTLRSTSTSATSVCVGSTSTTCATATGGIKAGPVDVSSVTSAGAVGIANSVPADTSFKLYNNAGTLSWNGSPLSVGGSTVSGTIGKLAKFTGAAAVGDSICSESGTTITCVNTVSATTLTGTLSTATQNSVTTMTGLVTVGTIGTGTWQGTKVNLTYGGTNADLSATGGTSQFLRQNTVGGTVTVVRPSVSDLSDASNVALLNAVNVFTGFGDNVFTSSGTGGNLLRVVNTSSGTANYAYLESRAGTTIGQLVSYSQGYTTGSTDIQAAVVVGANGAGGLSLLASHASGILRFYTGGSAIRWGINAAGDYTFGPSAHISDSSGTPTITSGFGSGGARGIIGTDYAFRVTLGDSSSAQGVVAFGHTFTAAPVCVAVADSSFTPLVGVPTTTQVTIFFQGDVGGETIQVLCRGF